MQSQKAVPAYFTSKQILRFGSAKKHYTLEGCAQITIEVNWSSLEQPTNKEIVSLRRFSHSQPSDIHNVQHPICLVECIEYQYENRPSHYLHGKWCQLSYSDHSIFSHLGIVFTHIAEW